MICPIFSEPETLLDRCVFSQNQHTFIPAQLRIRRDVHIELSVFFQRKNIDVILFSDINLADRAIHPFRRNGHFHDGVVVLQLDIIQNVFGAVSDRRSLCQLLFRVDHFIRTVAQQELGLYIPLCTRDHKLCSQLLEQ